MRVLVVSQYFWPENFRVNDLCAELVKRGHEVTILTGKPNYPNGEVFKEFLNSPKSFAQYKGGKVVRVPMLARGKNSAFKLILNYLTFAFSATFIGAWKLKGKQFDIIFVFEPSPITVGLPAIFLKKLKSAPVVFWVLDLWPETLEAVGVIKSKHALNIVGWLVSFIYNQSDLVLGQSKAFYSGISRYCNDRSKIKYFPSWSEEIFVSKSVLPIEEVQKYTGFKVLFAGNIGEAQDFPAILLAIKILKKEQLNFKVFIVGDGRALSGVKQEVKRLNIEEHVVLLGRQPLDLMPNFYIAADALLVTLKESPVFSLTIPGKLQSYMAAGKPILTMLTGEGSRVVREAGCGYVAKSGDARSLANNIKKMSSLSCEELALLGKKAKEYSNLEFNRTKLISQLENWFFEVASKTKEHKG